MIILCTKVVQKAMYPKSFNDYSKRSHFEHYILISQNYITVND